MNSKPNLASELLTLLTERDDDIDRYQDALLLIAERVDSIDKRIDDSIEGTEEVREQLSERIVEGARMHAKLMQRVHELERSRAFTEAYDGQVHLSEAEQNILGMSNSLANPSGPERRALEIVRNWNDWALSGTDSTYLDITTGNLDKLLEQATEEKLDNKQVYDAMERAEVLTHGKLKVMTRRFGGKGRKRKILTSNGDGLILTEEALREALSKAEPSDQNNE